MSQLEHLDEIAREAWAGNYDRVGVLSKGERLYMNYSTLCVAKDGVSRGE